MEKRPLQITETVLRDAHQSLVATRMRTGDMIPVLEDLDKVGYHAIEAWGGATFDSCLRFLDEDPWERLRTLKKHLKNTPIQMLLRGQNLLGYNHYPDDVVREFVRLSVENGVSIIRIFDALNDVRNLEVSMDAAKKAGAHAQGTLIYTVSPYTRPEDYLKLARQLVDMGADSICIEDRLDKVLEEMPKVRAELGYPPLVTPTSQIVGSMALMNVAVGRYKMIPMEVKDLIRGRYGRTPGPISPEVRKLAIGDQPVIDHRPADDLAPQLDTMWAKLQEKGFTGLSREDLLSYILFPEVALSYFEKHRRG